MVLGIVFGVLGHLRGERHVQTCFWASRDASWGRLGGSWGGFWRHFLVPATSLSLRVSEQQVHDEEKCES